MDTFSQQIDSIDPNLTTTDKLLELERLNNELKNAISEYGLDYAHSQQLFHLITPHIDKCEMEIAKVKRAEAITQQQNPTSEVTTITTKSVDPLIPKALRDALLTSPQSSMGLLRSTQETSERMQDKAAKVAALINSPEVKKPPKVR